MTETTFPDLPGWSFHVDEVSMGVYEAIGKHVTGPSVYMKGQDPHALLEQCSVDAKRMSRTMVSAKKFCIREVR